MLNFQPEEGGIVWCDFTGLQVPEMVKKRPSIIIKKHKTNSKLVHILPISNTIPLFLKDHHYELDINICENLFNGKRHIVKIDMIYTVSLDRLFSVRNKKTGQRSIPVLDKEITKIIKFKLIKYLNV